MGENSPFPPPGACAPARKRVEGATRARTPPRSGGAGSLLGGSEAARSSNTLATRRYSRVRCFDLYVVQRFPTDDRRCCAADSTRRSVAARIGPPARVCTREGSALGSDWCLHSSVPTPRAPCRVSQRSKSVNTKAPLHLTHPEHAGTRKLVRMTSFRNCAAPNRGGRPYATSNNISL